jgi:Tol biopolymer transport system component
MKVSANGGEETPVFGEKTGYYCAFSPDGNEMAYHYRDKETKEFAVAVRSMENQNIVKRYSIPPRETSPYFLKWTADGTSLSYITDDGKGKNSLWIQSLDGANPKFAQDLGSQDIMDFQISPDGKTFAFIRGDWKHDSFLLTGLK